MLPLVPGRTLHSAGPTHPGRDARARRPRACHPRLRRARACARDAASPELSSGPACPSSCPALARLSARECSGLSAVPRCRAASTGVRQRATRCVRPARASVRVLAAKSFTSCRSQFLRRVEAHLELGARPSSRRRPHADRLTRRTRALIGCLRTRLACLLIWVVDGGICGKPFASVRRLMRESARLPPLVVRMRPSDVEHGLEDRHDASGAYLACALERQSPESGRKQAAGEIAMRSPLEWF
ncbi:hypothetical protein OH76DRAFT_777871 [Lentinus brumalis]|uniref:Uncharacterized protein n=1 Tax=Lentinus brumalis TaxID=2498619 RepID=A0A371D4A7_9APHY|nr:hypothetical protein OH76DRAFT_777871 [Polyporus brumalis]